MNWPGALRGTPLERMRWVVVDTETSGLDASRERLLSVGAVVVRDRGIVLAESFHRNIRQESPSPPENIVIHGIGADAQRAGDPAAAVLADFRTFLDAGTPVGFNASFDHAVLRKAAQPVGVRIAGRWLDLARLAPALEPQRARSHRTLDEWLEAWGIQAQPRHDALADALATAQLLLVLLQRAMTQGCQTDRDVLRIAASARWLT